MAYLCCFGAIGEHDAWILKEKVLSDKKLKETVLRCCGMFWSPFAVGVLYTVGFHKQSQLQLRRPYESLCPQWCMLCKGDGESIDHLFLHCPLTIGLWHKLFNLARLDWVPPRSIEDMMIIAFRGLGNSIRGKTLWQITCLTLLWIVWQQRNARIFEDEGRSEGMLQDLLHFYSSLWASSFVAFRGVPLSVL